MGFAGALRVHVSVSFLASGASCPDFAGGYFSAQVPGSFFLRIGAIAGVILGGFRHIFACKVREGKNVFGLHRRV